MSSMLQLDPQAEIAALKRRLDRERKARVDAEAIAERGLRSLYDKQQQLELLGAIAKVANETRSVRDMLQFALTRITKHTGWTLGHAWINVDQGSDHKLVSSCVWNENAPAAFEEFRRLTELKVLSPGVGLPGRVLETGAPVWINDIFAEGNFPRREAAIACGLRSAFAFPVLVGEEAVAVLEFGSTQIVEKDETLLAVMAQIGTTLGRVTERKRSEDKLIHDASHDPLTGLPNRALFKDRLGRALARCQRHPTHKFAVLFIDLDRFKLVNDSLGHHAGDMLIVKVAERILQSLRREDLVTRPSATVPSFDDSLARLGGDEFTILLDDISDPADAVRVGDRVLDVLKAPFTIEGQEVYTSASIGIASSASGYATGDDLLRDADLAMYRAKALGKARCEVFDQTMYELATRRLTLETDLRRALEHDEFMLHYQPIVELGDETIVGFEALVRWNRPGLGLVSPMDFIPVAEDTGLIVAIGAWVLREACRTMKRWHDQFPRKKPLTISVNLSPRQFAQRDLVGQIQQIINESGIDPTTVRLEITETVTMGDAERTIAILNQLRSIGLRLSIDDFGTGYSSLSYLHRFPLDTLKIDRSFVMRMDEGSEGIQIITTIMNLARNLGIDVIAEGTETRKHVDRLKSLGCDFGQGYFFSRPVNDAAAQALLEKKDV